VYIATHHYKGLILTYIHRLIRCRIKSPGYCDNYTRKSNVATYKLNKLVSKVDHFSLHGGINATDGKIYCK
jgi:hypothetical protein